MATPSVKVSVTGVKVATAGPLLSVDRRGALETGGDFAIGELGLNDGAEETTLNDTRGRVRW